MHKDIEPITIATNLSTDPKSLPGTVRIPKGHFTYCPDLTRNFALAPINIEFGGTANLAHYAAYCDGETEFMMEYKVIDWFTDRGMGSQLALNLLLGVNRRNANRIV